MIIISDIADLHASFLVLIPGNEISRSRLRRSCCFLRCCQLGFRDIMVSIVSYSMENRAKYRTFAGAGNSAGVPFGVV